MRALYNSLFSIVFAMSSPYYFARMLRRGKWRAGFGQRFGRYGGAFRQSVCGQEAIWLHAVSVGEMNVCVELVRALEACKPDSRFVVSTTTTTGMNELQKKLPPRITKIYYPIDHRKFVSRALEAIRPNAIVLMEAEVWPNFIWQAHDRGIPLFLANARLSDRSYPRYRRCGFLFQELFGAFVAIGAQTEVFAAKFRELGCPAGNVHVLGNMKFDTAKLDATCTPDVPSLLAQMGISNKSPLLVAGSTHRGEERILAQQFLRLRKRFQELFLVLVPRHAERSGEVGKTLESCGLRYVRRTDLLPDVRYETGAVNCLLVNTTGELMSFYKHATVVFVGKSLTAKGGQNPIEPAALGRATVFGPNMQNFRDVAHIFISQHGAVQVRNADDLERVLAELLADPAGREELGSAAQRIVSENRGAVARTVRMIVTGMR
jgi:3-deoxy-D-manno-octulosonic-acid transferase